MNNRITEGKLFGAMLEFSVPYLISTFLVVFYNIADLMVTGWFNPPSAVTAVSVGGQVMHMLTVILAGFAMGTTVSISRQIGAGDSEKASLFAGNSITMFLGISVVLTAVLLIFAPQILWILQTPQESMDSAMQYIRICFVGVPFLAAYTLVSAMFRGIGDTKSPMIYVAIAGIVNVGLDILLVGPLAMGAAGAAIATVMAQVTCVLLSVLHFVRKRTALTVRKMHLRPDAGIMRQVISIGIPISCQDGLIQVTFLVITAIANMRGVNTAAAVGIVEKIIGILFLVPSAMLSTVSAVSAQNAGVGRDDRSRLALKYGILSCLCFGVIVVSIAQWIPGILVGIFVQGNSEIVKLGTEYLRAYSIDCILAGIHFCFSGFFSAYGRSIFSFLHNILSAVLIRVPVTYIASVMFPETLFPMGLASPLGSVFSVLLCIFLYRKYFPAGPNGRMFGKA